MQDWLEPLAGGIVLVLTLLDVFFTVLYARAGTGLLAPSLARGVWRVFRGLSGARQAGILGYCGPVQLVALVLMWGVLLALGSGLVIHPALGTGVKSSSGATDTGFVTALFVGGSSVSIVGASDYGPVTAGYKVLFLFNSLIGMSVTTLTLTYLMQVYTALRNRNTLGLKVQAQSGDTGDAAELRVTVACIGMSRGRSVALTRGTRKPWTTDPARASGGALWTAPPSRTKDRSDSARPWPTAAPSPPCAFASTRPAACSATQPSSCSAASPSNWPRTACCGVSRASSKPARSPPPCASPRLAPTRVEGDEACERFIGTA